MIRSIFRDRVRPAVSRCLLLATCSVALFLPTRGAAQGYAPGDFIVADYGGSIAVFDRDFVFKHLLDSNFPLVGGLDFTSTGELVAIGRTEFAIRRYAPTGATLQQIPHFSSLGAPIDIKVGPGDHLFVATQQNGVAELTLSGAFIRKIGADLDPQGLAILPNGELWVGHGSEGPFIPNHPIQVFSTTTGNHLRSIFTSGENEIGSMYYSAATNTILTTDGLFGRVRERRVDGSLLREFGGNLSFSYGVTRGLNGNVYVTGQLSSGVAEYSPIGTFLRSIPIGSHVGFPINIIQVPVPEASALTLLCVGCAILSGMCRSRNTPSTPTRAAASA